MPVVRRQFFSLIAEAFESSLSTASVGLVGTTPAVATTDLVPVLPTTTTSTAIVVVTAVPDTSSSTSSTIAPIVTDSVITTTSTSSTSSTSTTPAVTSSSTSASSFSSTPLTTPVVSTSGVSTVPTTTRAIRTPSASAIGVSANSGSNGKDNMSSGIVALIVVGAILAALLAGAFAFRRIQVYRRAKRRANNYGAGEIPTNSPFTNVSQTDLKGAQSIRDIPQGSQFNEKPLPSIVPDLYPQINANPTFGQPTYGDNGMSGSYPGVGVTVGYGYAPTTRAPSPAQSQATWQSAAPTFVTVVPGGPVNASYPNPTASPPPSVPPPAVTRPAPQVANKKRVIQTFQPTLPDELDIREGDWVTVVHAYDDGWGLCECNGRRGVVPLECLDFGNPDIRANSDIRASRRFSSLPAAQP